jgi:hypothetical protein
MDFRTVVIVLKQAALTELNATVIEGPSDVGVLRDVGSDNECRFRNSVNPLILLVRLVKLHNERPPHLGQ